MKLTFTLEAIAGMDPTRLGELIRHRVGIGARVIEIVTLDEAIGRLSAMGVPLVGDVSTITVPVEVESRYPAPTPQEIDDLLAKIAGSGYASDAGQAVEDWMESRYGVVGDYTRKLREEEALHNVEEVGMSRWKTSSVLADRIRDGDATVDPVGLEPGERVEATLAGSMVVVERPKEPSGA